jgi:hypothetical protein
MHSPESDVFLKKRLKEMFTNNPRNTKAIQCDPAKIPNAIKYINKESSDFYYYVKHKKEKVLYEFPEYEQYMNPLDNGIEIE